MRYVGQQSAIADAMSATPARAGVAVETHREPGSGAGGLRRAERVRFRVGQAPGTASVGVGAIAPPRDPLACQPPEPIRFAAIQADWPAPDHPARLRHTTLTLMEHAGVLISIVSKWAGQHHAAFTERTDVHANTKDLSQGRKVPVSIHKIAQQL